MGAEVLPVARHAAELARFLGETANPTLWLQTADWLTIASGILQVDFDLTRFDDSRGWCRDADEFNDARETLLQEYVKELTQFTYCWGAFECAVDKLDPPPAPKRGKINGACYYIKQNAPDDQGVPHYREALDDLRRLVAEFAEPRILERFSCPAFVSARSLAPYVIYELRNRFVHGALSFPWPDGDNRPRSPAVRMVRLASRLTLMTIQHLLAAAHRTYVHTWEADVDGEEAVHEFHAFLALLHVGRSCQGNGQRLPGL